MSLRGTSKLVTMALLDQLQKDIVAAMKAREETRLDALRMLKTALMKYKVDTMKDLDEQAELQILNMLVKQRRESADMFRKGDRPELADKEEAELKMIEAYMPSAPTDAELDTYMVRREELVVIAKPNHRLATRRQISVKDLRDEYLIVQGTRSVLRERIVQALRASKIPFNFGVENVGIEAIKRMVINGLGVGFVPTMCVSEEVINGKLVALKVADLRTDWNISMVWRKDHSLSRIARDFVDIIKPSRDAATTIVNSRRIDPNRSRKVVHC